MLSNTKNQEKCLDRLHYEYIFQNSPRAIDVCDIDGLIIDMNKESEKLWKISKFDFINKRNFFELERIKEDEELLKTIKSAIDEKELKEIKCYLTHDNSGKVKWVSTHIYPVINEKNEVIRFIISNSDETKKRNKQNEKKITHKYKEMGREILQVLNEPQNLEDSLQTVLNIFKNRTEFDAIGIRLQKDIDYPFFVHTGFSKEFLEKENSLLPCSLDQNDKLCWDEYGNIRLECTCGMIISSLKNSLITEGGSFWTNDASLLKTTDESIYHLRNTCVAEGFFSIALIPIKNKDKTVGLIQLNSKKKDQFTKNTIEILEQITSHLGVALVRKKVEQDLYEINKQREILYTDLVYKNQIFESLSLISRILLECNEPTNLNQVVQIVGETLETSRAYIYEILSPNNLLKCRYEYTNNVRPFIDDIGLNNKSLNDLNLSFTVSDLIENRIVIVNDTYILEKNDFYIKENIKSFILFPIFISHKLYGFMGLDQCFHKRIWKDYEIEIIKNLSNLVGLFIKKCFYERRLDKFMYNQSLILNNLDSYVWFFKDINIYGFINESYYSEFIRNQTNNKTYRDNCLLEDCHIFEESQLQKSTNEEVFNTNNILKYNQWLTNKSGSRRLLSIKKIPVIDDTKNYIVCIAKDITEQYYKERDLISSFKEIYNEKKEIIDNNITEIQQSINISKEIILNQLKE